MNDKAPVLFYAVFRFFATSQIVLAALWLVVLVGVAGPAKAWPP